jgi:hypothetical protein
VENYRQSVDHPAGTTAPTLQTENLKLNHRHFTGGGARTSMSVTTSITTGRSAINARCNAGAI